ncbi:ABC transporter permease [Ferrimonas sediminicola]|uniref:ABC transporter permease n=1 Tax=Ferrimonas sediminicola TaxID=2569538 RepID=A0A4U1BB88_9GAMM|nr:ABC transporter permease [Ferrimonas sediminicola]TKB48128.1 ABC transporter permease [Ferrimonas sediminicola]
MMSRILTLFLKELKDGLRDRRSVMAAMSYALTTPLVFAGIFMITISDISEKMEVPITIEGADHAPDLVRFLGAVGIEHDPQEPLGITLTIPAAYAEQMSRGEPAEVLLTADASRKELAQPLGQIKKVIRAYADEMASLRLVARGINPKVIQPVELVFHDKATNESKASLIMGAMLLSILLSLFISGMNVAIDTSAGERERNSLALLLCQPVSTLEIVLAKALTVTSFALLGLLLTMVVSVVVFAQVPWHELGFSLKFTPVVAGLIVAICLPVALFAATAQLFFSFFAKSFKEAQSYLTLLLFIPMALIMLPTFELFGDVLKWLPISGQQLAITEMIKEQPIPLAELAVSSLATLGLTLMLIWANARALKSEKVVFAL